MQDMTKRKISSFLKIGTTVAKIAKPQEAINKTEGKALYWVWSIENTNLVTASLARGNRNLKNEHTRG